MLARLWQGFMIGSALLGCGWFWLFRDAPVWVQFAGFCLVPGLNAWFLAIEFALMRIANRSDPAPRASVGQLLRAWGQEFVASLRIFGWWQPFRSHAEPDLWRPGKPGQRGVVLIHGFACNRGVWTLWLRALRAEGRVVMALNLEPALGTIDGYAAQVDDAVTRVTAATGLTPVLVCHSMGGLAARAWLRAGAPGNDARVRHIITLGTPHHGTWLGHLAPAGNMAQMRHRGAWARQLAKDEPPRRAALLTCWYANCDNIVFPSSNATLAGANNRLAAGLAHLQLVLDPGIMRATLQLIRAL